MSDAFIIDAIHTPRGRRNGALAGVHPIDLYGLSLRALLDRTAVDPNVIEDVVTGCVSQAGEQGRCMARAAVLAAGLPQSVPGVSLDRFCGSGLQAINFAAMAVQSGHMDVVIAGGVESMSRMPIGSAWGTERPRTLTDKYDISTQFVAAERIADKYGISREECDQFAVESQRRAAAAHQEGRFARQIAPVKWTDPDGHCHQLDHNEHMRPGTTVEDLSRLTTIAPDGRVVTAGNASGVVDASAAVLVAGSGAAKRLDLTPRARIVATDVTGSDPYFMLTGIIPATSRVLAKAGLTLADIDLVEINEAFAPIPLAWMREFDFDPARINVNGGAIALGHPLGATGAILAATIIDRLQQTRGRYGLITICMGYGMGIATIVERL